MFDTEDGGEETCPYVLKRFKMNAYIGVDNASGAGNLGLEAKETKVKRECALQCSLLHPNIIKSFCYWPSDKDTHLLMSYADKGAICKYKDAKEDSYEFIDMPSY